MTQIKTLHSVCTQGLLHNHERLEMEIKAFSGEIERLKEMSKKVASSASSVATFVSRIVLIMLYLTGCTCRMLLARMQILTWRQLKRR